MTYSFFGTCSNDYEQLFSCLETILNQSIIPKEIILVDSGHINIRVDITKMLNCKPIKLIYIRKNLPRVNALNISLGKSTAEYSFRFDTRSRFSKQYAENALNILNNKSIDAKVVGGVPSVLSESNYYEAKLCSEIMSRSYTFFYPKHRTISFSGYSSSIYLGCFKTTLLKQIKFLQTNSLISEDSLIINNFINKGYKAYLSSKISVSYVCRSSFKNTLKLFNTYGYCRANTILLTRKIFISARHALVASLLLIIQLFLLKFSLLFLFIFPLIAVSLNIFGEIIQYKRGIKIIVPFCATICQLSWICGFCWRIMTILKKKNIKSNFIS